MIPKAIIDQFLEAKRDDHRWVKELSDIQIGEELAALRPVPRLYPKARRHQRVCFLLGVSYPQFGFWLDMGLGKTLLALELLRYWRDDGRLRRALITVTSDKAYLTWERQIKLYGIDLPYVFLEGSSEDKWRQLEAFGDGLVIVHYPGLVAMLTQPVKKGRKTVWTLDDKKVTKFGLGIDAVVADESTKLGNQQSLSYKIVNRLAQPAFARYALAGRPFGRDPTLAWSQYKLLDGGATLGGTLGLFREAFCTAEQNYAARSKWAIDYKFKKRMMPKLTEMMQHRSITYTEDECPDLPKLTATREVSAVKLPQEAAIYYDRLVDQIVAAKGNYSLMNNAFVRMRQLSSGFIAMRDDDDGERVEVEFKENPKLDRLMELIDEIPENRQAVIFYDFTHSGRTIYETLKAAGTNSIWLWSGTSDAKADLNEYQAAQSKYKVAIVNNKVGAYSLDGLQVANYTFFYESPVSVLDRDQAERRILRQGQQRHVFQYDVVVRDTMDEKILAFHREGRDLYKELTRSPKEFFGRKG